MNRKLLISLLVLGLGSVLYTQNYQYQKDILWVTTPKDKDWLYQLNEETDMTVPVYRYGVLLDDMEVGYSIGPELMTDTADTRYYILAWIGKNLR